MYKKFDKKITENNIDEFINEFYEEYIKSVNDKFVFDLSEVEWISNQELLVLSGIIKYLYENKKEFEIIFFKKGISTSEISNRVKKQIIQIWEVWKIWKLIPIEKHLDYFGINTNSVEILMEELNYYPQKAEIYNRYGITPLIILEKVNNYSDDKIYSELSKVFSLNEATNELLSENNCSHPFTKFTLSSIITKELYENFLDHFGKSFYKSDKNWAFMSLSLIEKREGNEDDIQKILELNFKNESIPETTGFYYNDKQKKYKNFSYLQFSFLDFGSGIVETLKNEYYSNDEKHLRSLKVNDDNEILKFSFHHDSSRHPIDSVIADFTKKGKVYLSRGLFDVLSIVKRYKGLLVIRSNNGKVLYDFSLEDDVESAFKSFGNGNYFFPGTLITIYIPALHNAIIFENSSIKPKYLLNEISYPKKKYVFFNEIYEKLKNLDKDQLYIELIKEVRAQIINRNNEPTTIYFSFYGWELDERLTKKTINILLTDYHINLKNNLIILNPPSENLLNEVKIEIQSLSQIEKDYIVHPLPFIFEGIGEEDLKLFWLGIYDETDANKLKRVLFGPTDLIKADFNEPNSILGNLNMFDQNGNLVSKLPYEEEIQKTLIDFIFKKFNCLRKDDLKHVYLCNGNYFQSEFFDFYNVLSDSSACRYLCKILFNKLYSKYDIKENYIYVSVTSSSHKIINSFIENKSIDKNNTIFFDNYHTFVDNEKFNRINEDDKIILVCDVIATGTLTERLISKLNSINAKLVYIVVFADLIDEKFENCAEFKANYNGKIISLYSKSIEKFRRDKINKSRLEGKKIIRVNPFTNVPIDFNIDETYYKDNVIFKTSIKYEKKSNLIEIKNELLDNINPNFIMLGYYSHLNDVHPYFFDTNEMMGKANYYLLKKIFDKIFTDIIDTKFKDLQIFYPTKSSIAKLDKDRLANDVFQNQSIKFYELERFGTKEGWKFPHTTEYFNEHINGKNILILDDGSTTGNSIMQMIDEISFFDVKEITVVCFIGRVNDHKREFFSRISKIRATSKKEIKVSIHFASHWHLPSYYLDENPNIKEMNWLNEIIEFQNTPLEIKRIADKVKSVIEPKTKDFYKDYKYLPLEINELGDKVVPKRDILKVRDEVGKIIGYRFYKQSFHFFDELMHKYDNQNVEKRYREIELLCAVFIYEPYLFSQIKEIVPDVVEKIELFVETLIFGNPRTKKQINLDDDLYYIWNKKDIVHLFFIVFKGEKIIEKIRVDNLIKLMKFTEPKESALSYILYKLLYYFPLDNKSLEEKKYSAKIKLLLDSIPYNTHTKSNLNLIKNYNSFLLSLPSKGSYETQILKIQSELRKVIDEKYHEDNISSYFDNISIMLEFLNNNFDINVVKVIEENWEKVSSIIENLLSFSITFPNFLLLLSNYDKNKIELLRSLLGQISSQIYSINKESSFNQLDYLITNRLKKYFLPEDSLYKLFSNIQCNISLLLIDFINDITNLYPKSMVNFSNLDQEIIIPIPKYIFEKIILFEILKNLRHCDFGFLIKISLKIDNDNSIKFEILNTLKTKVQKGSGRGIERLKLMNEFPNESIKYYFEETKTEFKQIIIINL